MNAMLKQTLIFIYLIFLTVFFADTEVVSLNPTCIKIETPLARRATRNDLIKSTFLEKTQSPVSGLCYARNRVCYGIIC